MTSRLRRSTQAGARLGGRIRRLWRHGAVSSVVRLTEGESAQARGRQTRRRARDSGRERGGAGWEWNRGGDPEPASAAGHARRSQVRVFQQPVEIERVGSRAKGFRPEGIFYAEDGFAGGDEG